MTGHTSAMGLLYTTWPDAGGAEAAAEVLLGEGLIACANILGESRSVFQWREEIRHERETIALFKTSRKRAEAAAARIAQLHPYDEPAILNLSVDPSGSAANFLSWVEQTTNSASGGS